MQAVNTVNMMMIIPGKLNLVFFKINIKNCIEYNFRLEYNFV